MHVGFIGAGKVDHAGLTTDVRAWRAARRKRFLTHRHNMTRAFVIATYFVGVRLMDRLGLGAMTFLTASKDAQFAHSDWIAWVIPVVLVEAYYARQWDALLKKRQPVTGP